MRTTLWVLMMVAADAAGERLPDGGAGSFAALIYLLALALCIAGDIRELFRK